MFGPISPRVKDLTQFASTWSKGQTWQSAQTWQATDNTFTRSNLATTTATSVRLRTLTDATLGTSTQVSPAIRFSSNTWDSNDSVSKDTSFHAYASGQTALDPIGIWKLDASVNNGALSNLMSVYSSDPSAPNNGGRFDLNGKIRLVYNNSSTVDTLSNLDFVNTSGNRTNITATFGSTIKYGIQVQDSGATYYKAAGSGSTHYFQVGSNIGATSDIIQIYGGGVYNYGGMFANGRVTAGSADTTTGTYLSTYGSFAVKGKLAYGVATYQIDENETVTYADASASNLCTGTPSASCASYTGSGEAVCNSHSNVNCAWNSGTLCSTYNSTDQGTCESGHSPCSWESTSCSPANNLGSTACTDQNTAWGGSCSYNTSTCPSQTSTASCNAITGCTATVDGDCTTLSDGGGDGTNCATQPECSYDSGSGVCSGLFFTACVGEICENTFFTGVCGGGSWGAFCSGTASCAPLVTSGTCAAEAGCTWSSAMSVFLPNSSTANRSNTSRLQWVKRIGATGTVNVYPHASDTGTTLESAISFTSQYQGVLVQHHSVSSSCTGFGTEGACTAESGCSWNPAIVCSDYNGNESSCLANGCSYSDPNCTGAGVAASCSGTYTSAKKWFKLASI